MTELSFGWANNATGDGAKISVVDSVDFFLNALGGTPGVLPGILNELTPTVSGSHILVNTGWALGKTGHPYRNNSSFDSGSLTPSTGTTGHRIVLREDLSAQTVRVHDIANTDGTSTIPAATSTDTTLCTLTITTGGVITMTEAREWAAVIPRVPALTSAVTYTTSTSFVDVSDGTNTLNFWAKANGRYRVRIVVPVSFGGTGGLKLQFTGPAAPTLVRADAYADAYSEQAADSNGNTERAVMARVRVGTATSFASPFMALNSAADASGGTIGTVLGVAPVGTTVVVDVLIVNGSTAGTIALQAAQNSSNSTTTLAIGSRMEVEAVG